MEQLAVLIQPMLVKYVLYCMIGVIVAFTVPLFIVLIVHKMRVEQHEQRVNELELHYTDMLGKMLIDPEMELPPPSSDIEFEALGSMLADLGIKHNSNVSARLRIIARSTGIDTYYQELAKSESWTKRYCAVEKLGFLRFPEFRSFFQSILEKEKEPHVLAKTIWALSLIATVNELPVINRLLNNQLFTSSKFKEYIYTNIIQTFRERDEIPAFMVWLTDMLGHEDLPMPLNKDIIEACGAEKLTEAESIICNYHDRLKDHPDILISCIRALESIGGEQACRVIRTGLQESDWRIRAVAAKHADAWGDEFLPTLEQLLHDTSYQVRINSAQTLFRCGERGLAVLSKGTESDDRFVRDICRYILAEVSHA